MSWLLIRFALVMVPIVLLVNGFTKGDWLEAFLFALSVAVGLTPEMLPMIVTSTLAKGAVLLSRKKVVVKRLDAIQNFGAMDVLCTDKTGTLTQDKIALDAPCRRLRPGVGRGAELRLPEQPLPDRAEEPARPRRARPRGTAAELKLEDDYRKVDEIPFDFERRRMSVVVAERDEHHQLICKGAVEEVLAVCTRVRVGGEIDEPLSHGRGLLARVQEVTRAERGRPARGRGGDQGAAARADRPTRSPTRPT